LLRPEDFGLAAMLGVFICVGICLTESGLGSALVVQKFACCGLKMEHKVMWWNLGVGIAFYLLLCVGAPWIADFYRQPILCPLARVMGIGIVVGAASTVPVARLTREMRFGALAWANGLSTFVAAVVAVGMAWRGAGVWSVATMGIVLAGVRTALVWMWGRRKEGRDRDGDAAGEGVVFRDLLGYGCKLMTSGLIHTVYSNIYELVMGRMLNPMFVGLYNRANGWVTAARNFVNPTVDRVAFPVLAQGAGPRTALRFLLLNLALLWSGLSVLWIWAPEIVGFVFGEKWLMCVPYLRILIVGQAFTPFENVALITLRARGRAGLILKTDAVKKPLGLVAFACGVPFGIVGICWAKVATDFFEAAADVWFAWGKVKR